MTTPRSLAAVLIGAALAATLAACSTPSRSTVSGGGPSPEPSTPASVSPSVSPTIEPSAGPTEPAARPELAQLTIGPQGLGPLAIGSPVVEEDAAVAVVKWKPDWCLVNGKVGDPYVGTWGSQYAPAEDQTYGGDYPFFVYTNGGVQSRSIRNVYVWSSEIMTSAGIHVGSTEAEVKAAYPKPDYVLPGNGTRMYVIDRAPGRMVIEIAAQKGYWTSGELGKVLWIFAQRSDVKATSIAGTDGTGGCGA